MCGERANRVLRRFVLVTLVLPAAVTTVGLVVQLAAFLFAGGSGLSAPTGWAPVGLRLGLTVGLGFGLPAAFGLSSLPALRREDGSPTFRLLGAQALGLSVLLTMITTARLLQRLGTGTSDLRRMLILLLAVLAVGTAAAVIGWLVQPEGPAAAPVPAVSPIELTPSERATWMRTVSLPIPAVAVITAVTTIVALKACVGWLAGDPDGVAALLTVVALLLIALLATTSTVQVRVDARGLSVRSVFGLPRFHIVAQEVRSVAVVNARSLGLRGSWGIRIRPSLVSVIMQPTTGIQVTRQDGRKLFVTVDDATTGAALLETLAARAGAATPET